MSGNARLPVLAGITATGVSLAAMFSSETVQNTISQFLGLSAPGGIWRAIALVLALANLKNLPFMWHIRLFRSLLYHLYLQPTPLPPRALFHPIITPIARVPLAECDYNLHKSNSTYFSDLDLARTNLVTALLRNGIRQLDTKSNKKSAPNPPTAAATTTPPPGAEQLPTQSGRVGIALGAVTCHFRREIVPYARTEIWTRLLCWDRKWLYLVSHIVKPGVARPKGYALQPWKKGKHHHRARDGTGSAAAKDEAGAGKEAEEERAAYREKLSRAVYATSIAKYVVKRGRWTVPPEVVLRNSGLLPERPEGSNSVGSGGEGSEAQVNGAATAPTTLTPETVDAAAADILAAEAEVEAETDEEEWTWEEIEAERVRGLKFADMFAGLDGLHELFDGGAQGALGEFGELIW